MGTQVVSSTNGCAVQLYKATFLVMASELRSVTTAFLHVCPVIMARKNIPVLSCFKQLKLAILEIFNLLDAQKGHGFFL